MYPSVSIPRSDFMRSGPSFEDNRIDVKYAISTDLGRRFSPAVSLAGNGAQVAMPTSSAERQELGR